MFSRRSICRRNSSNNRRGVATVEMAMVVPVVFLMIFGAIEFSRMMMIRQALTNASRTGSRTAALITTQTQAKVDAAVRNALKGVIANPETTEVLRITCGPTMSADLESGTEINVSVEVDCSDVSWLPPFFTAGASIHGSSMSKRE